MSRKLKIYPNIDNGLNLVGSAPSKLKLKSNSSTAFITEWAVPTGSFTFPLKSGNTYNCVIDWGDGTLVSNVTSSSDPNAIHYYTAGTYQIKITGVFTSIYVNNGSVKTYLKKVIQWGNVGFTTFNAAFFGCSNLNHLPNGPITGIGTLEANTFQNCFYFCSALNTIPSGLFDNCTTADRFGSCFGYCSALTYIPSGLFDNNTDIYDFGGCFKATAITAIPSGLFDNNTAITNFYECFAECVSLTAIPSGLFNNNILATQFNLCFRGTGITSIPSGLFKSREYFFLLKFSISLIIGVKISVS